jgi:sugar/nucleoside kinase (ribokinase family)
MAIIAVGSLALDSINTAKGARKRILGGSLTHFANAASFLSKPLLVGVVGNDLGNDNWEFIKSKAGSTEGIVHLDEEKCFFWEGVYSDDYEKLETVRTELNAFAKFNPVVPDSYKKETFILFLANIDPVIQEKVLAQSRGSMLRILDTMNFWIKNSRENLDRALDEVDGILINEEEAFLLTCEKNIVKAAEKMFRPSFKIVIIKKGSGGSMIFGPDFIITLPAFPLHEITDPTGAGDCFAGAFMSYLDHNRIRDYKREVIKNAAVYATVVASFSVEDFGVEGLRKITARDINNRCREFRKMAAFK